MKNVIYVGAAISEKNTAMYVHTHNMAELLKAIHYRTIFVSTGKRRKVNIYESDGFEHWETPQYLSIPKMRAIEVYWEILFGTKLFHLLCDVVRQYQPDLVIFYGYQAEDRIIKHCRNKKIPIVVERVDWFEADDVDTFTLEKKIWINQIQRSYNALDYAADGIIAISPYLEEHFRKKNMKVIKIPPIFKIINEPMTQHVRKDGMLRLVYAGSIGGKKDIILPVIDAVIRINCDKIVIQLDLVGINDDTLTLHFGWRRWEECGIRAHGRCSHDRAIEIIKEADFSFLLRYDKKYAKAGFSTKFAESMINGVPVICTRVGGADTILQSNVDGIVIEDNEVSTIITTLQRLLKLTGEQVFEMKRNARRTAENHFTVQANYEKMKEFVESLISSNK